MATKQWSRKHYENVNVCNFKNNLIIPTHYFASVSVTQDCNWRSRLSEQYKKDEEQLKRLVFRKRHPSGNSKQISLVTFTTIIFWPKVFVFKWSSFFIACTVIKVNTAQPHNFKSTVWCAIIFNNCRLAKRILSY